MKRHSNRDAGCLFGLLLLTTALFAQPAVPPLGAGYVETGRYINSFFGFALKFPSEMRVNQFGIARPDLGNTRFLFGAQTLHEPLSVLMLSAEPSNRNSSDEVREGAGSKLHATKRIEIGGKEFWKSESQQKPKGLGTMQQYTYATRINGYILTISLLCFDHDLCTLAARDIEEITFFDPAKAEEVAGPQAYPFPPPSGPAARSSR
jgi:hypothetical protein